MGTVCFSQLVLDSNIIVRLICLFSWVLQIFFRPVEL